MPRYCRRLRPAFSAAGLTGLVSGLLLPALAGAQEKITYQDHVRPVFENRCLNCHNADKKRGDLDLATYSGTMEGGSGGAVVEAGDPAASKLVLSIRHEAEPVMPPKGDRIPDAEIELIAKWIAGGLLETGSSTARKKKATGIAMDASAVTSAKPDGPPPMPEHVLLQPVVAPPHADAVTAIAHSPWAPLAALAAPRGVLLFNTDTGELAGVLPFPGGGSPECVRFSRNGALVLAGGGIPGKSGTVAVWEVKSGRRVITLQPEDEFDTILAADISADLGRIATGGPGRKVRLYDASTLECIATIKKHTDWVTAVAFSPDGVLLATGDRGGGLYVWEAWTGNEFYTLKDHEKRIAALAWRGDSNLLAAGSEDGNFTWWEMAGGSRAKKVAAHGGVLALDFAGDGRMVSGGRDGHIRLWDAAGNQKRDWVPADGSLTLSAVFTNDGTHVLTGAWNGEFECWNAEADGEPLALAANPPTIESRLTSLADAIATATTAADDLAAAAAAAGERVARAKSEVAAGEAAANEAARKVAESDALITAAADSIRAIQASRDRLVSGAAETAASLKVLTESAPPPAADPAPPVPDSIEVLLRKADESAALVDRLRIAVLTERRKTIAALLVEADTALAAAGARHESAVAAKSAATAEADAAQAALAEKRKALEEAEKVLAEAAAKAADGRKNAEILTNRQRYWQAALLNTEALRLAESAAAADEAAAAAKDEVAAAEATVAAVEQSQDAAGLHAARQRLAEATAAFTALQTEAEARQAAAAAARESYLSALPPESESPGE